MHYLDNAATSFPKPPCVVDAMVRALRSDGGNPGRGASAAAGAARNRLETARRRVAEFVGTSDARRVAFTLNATDSLSMALRSLVAAGRPAVVTALEHAAILRPLRRLQSELGGELRVVTPSPDGRIDPDDVRCAARGAGLVAMTCASNVLGVAQPWREVATALADDATPLLLDAAQAAGSLAFAFDELGPHVAVAITGHKALCGPMGVGALIVGDALSIGPWREGGTGDSESDRQPASMPTRLEAGTPPLPAIEGLAAALEWWTASGVDRVRTHEAHLLGRLLDGLAEIPGIMLPGINPQARDLRRAPLVSFRVDGWRVDELGAVLDSEFGITVRAGLACAPEAHRFLGTHPEGLVRASIGPTTAPESVEALLSALRQLAAAS